MDVDKVIITNMGALREKYGSKVSRIEQAIDRLLVADKKRGLETRLLAVDSKPDMEAVHGTVVKNKNDQAAVKKAVDSVYKACQPDYIMILGAPDILPHQDLKNPAYDPNGDEDRVVPSDIPYACEAPYSKEPSKFIGPTRVVGRLPDLPGVKDPAYLVSLLGTSARHKTRARADFQKYFSVTAEVWKESTSLSLTRLFGSSSAMANSPPKGPAWSTSQLGKRVHFINCHGAPSDPNFYGQKGQSYPVAHSAKKLIKKIMNGTVVAAECCYGAELYDPADSDLQSGICSTYLRDGAYGYFGSSTIAYGPSEGNGQADLICQYFLEEVLNGASLGEAALRARHSFAGAYTHLDPVDLKTAVQFNLLGDPSVHAVGAVSHAFAKTKTFKQAFDANKNIRGTRALRREKLARTGTNLADTLGAVKSIGEGIPAKMAEILKSAAKESGILNYNTRSFTLSYPGKGMKRDMVRFNEVRKGRRVHMLMGKRDLPAGAPGRVVAVVATWQDDKLIHIRRIHSR
ncbi:hypothetical protein PITCH_A290056 [uncultured Desulfobacterium sp.]|uniref:Uncharacterized protein n=1 Tax=uncultured Desulfobacterium sp. TaxID=201089 RepID=A0A445MZ78_9BACT|nr:hypothetical protein PITCH_A290056 [uncultured Desulfobacterium sp.]